MDDLRVGRIVRALRRRLRWTQKQLGAKAGCSQSAISLIERGHLDRLSNRRLRRVLGALDASSFIEIRWRGGNLDRLLDEDSAVVVGFVAGALRAYGWLVQTEVTYSRYREHGSYDIIAFHPSARIVLVIEVKTDLPSVEATLRRLDEKTRLARVVARERLGWNAVQVATLLVMPANRTLRRRVARHDDVIGTALPGRGLAIRKWLADPKGSLAGLWFVTITNPRGASQPGSGRSRVDPPRTVTDTNAAA